MPIVHAGTFPLSSINLGLSASLPGLSAEVSALSTDITSALANVIAQAEVAVNIPDPATLGIAAVASLSPAELTSCFAGMLSAGPDVSTELTADLAIVTGQIAIVQAVTSPLSAGLAVEGISGWTYGGRVDRFGGTFTAETRTGFGTVAATQNIQATIVVTETFGSWQALGSGVNTGGTFIEESEDDSATLNFLGTLGGAEWNTGTATVSAQIEAFLDELRGEAASLQATIAISLGADLPAVDLVVDAGLDVFAELGADGLLNNLVNANVDFAADISVIQARIDALLALISDIETQLSAGGLSLFTYTGTFGELGAAIQGALRDGVPNGTGRDATVYAIVLAGSATDMTTFGSIFAV